MKYKCFKILHGCKENKNPAFNEYNLLRCLVRRDLLMYAISVKIQIDMFVSSNIVAFQTYAISCLILQGG